MSFLQFISIDDFFDIFIMLTVCWISADISLFSWNTEWQFWYWLYNGYDVRLLILQVWLQRDSTHISLHMAIQKFDQFHSLSEFSYRTGSEYWKSSKNLIYACRSGRWQRFWPNRRRLNDILFDNVVHGSHRSARQNGISSSCTQKHSHLPSLLLSHSHMSNLSCPARHITGHFGDNLPS